MDEPLRISKQLEDGPGSTAMPFAINDWLSVMPNRQILVIGVNEEAVVDRAEQLVVEILRYDSRASLKRADDSLSLNTPFKVEFNPGGLPTLPYNSGRFDLVICAFLSTGIEIRKETMLEIGRVLRPDGHLIIIDNLVPGSRLRGKKARQMHQAGDYVNSWMRLRNPQHKKHLDQDSWIQLLEESRWNIQKLAICEVLQDFDTWADNYLPSPNNCLRLKAMLVQAPEKVRGFLTPEESGDRIAFRMTEVFILATMAWGAE